MKFHRVKVENLNSLYGVQTIDFEEDVRGSALFLIVGPTGAGKSTILDAICLALFGQTPRLGRRVGRTDTDVSHIMSIGTANAYAEVEFSTLQADGSRARYLAAWSARRAYDDPEGSVQRPERSLYRKFPDGSMKLIVSDHREKYFQPGFDEALRGLSVDDFKRSILLAQGEFSAFLHAADSEKASILERLTNTDNYRRIGKRAARRRRDVDERHRKLLTRLEEMQVLTLAQEAELKSALVQQAELSKLADAAAQKATSKVQWLQKLEDLEARLDKATEAVEKANDGLLKRADDQARLDRDAGLLDVEPAWREVERTRETIAQATNALEPIEKCAEELLASATQLTEAEKLAVAAATAATKALDDAQPEIRRSHELRTRRDEAGKRKKSAEELAEKKATALAQVAGELEVAAKKSAELLTAAEKADARVEELAKAKGLLERLPAIRASFEDGIEPLRTRAATLQQQVEALREDRKTVVATRAELEEQLAEGRKERGKWQAQVTRAQNKLDATIEDGRDAGVVVNELTVTLKAATQRAEALREARYLLVRIDEQQSERAELDGRLKEARTEVEQLAAEEATLKEVETAQRTTVRSSEEALRQNERVIALSAYRRDLHTGNPCPLCGSPIHPYCESMELADLDAQAAEDRKRLEGELAEARTTLSATNEKIQRLAGKFVARKTALAKDDARVFAIRSALEQDQRAFSVSAEKAGYAPLEAFRLKNSQLLASDLYDASTKAEAARASLDSIEQARQAVTAANDKLAAAQATFADVEKRAEELDDQVRQLDDRLVTRATDIKACQADLDRASKQLLDELAAHGIDVKGATVEQALERAVDLRGEVHGAAEKAKRAHETIAVHKRQVERLTERHTTAETERAEAQTQLQVADESTAKLDAEIAETLQGRDPAKVKQELDEAVNKTRTALANAQKARAEHAEATSANNARRDELQKQRESATKALTHAEDKLAKTLTKLGLEQKDVQQHLLAPDERKRLKAELGELAAAKTRAVDRRDDTKQRLEQHTETPLASADVALTDAVEELEAARAHANQMTLELGALRERWEKHEQTTSRRVEIEDELREVQQELDVWTTIYGLIGMRDGESFKLFAQSLNLQGLVDNANARLQKLHARYELTVARGDAGEPTLSFMVRDRYQANVERPLTTLSGGETFLVSLALALGLADFRRIDMPIETLLLDEGFGSLDQDSLHMALTTLHQLHRDASRQIGIISHVDALKELIDARIVVEPRGHGRSTLRFEFGAQPTGSQLEIITL